MHTLLEHITAIVVDDNADNLFILADTLREDLGIPRVYEVDSGGALFALLEAEAALSPELILLDLQMPNEDGYVVFGRIRAHPRLRAALVVAVTANVRTQDLERCREVGFDGFIGKPLSLERLPDQIQRIVARNPVWEAR